MPGLYVNDAGTWKEITTTAPQAHNGASYVPVKEVHVNDAGTWKKVWPTAVPPLPTNFRFQFTRWNSNRYEVQPLWDPINITLADGYHIEVTRVGGGASQENKQIVDTGRENWWYDIFVGAIGGAVLTYRVRSYKGAAVGAWSSPITTTTPGDAGWIVSVGMGTVNDVFGNYYHLWQIDGNTNSVQYDLYRKQVGYYDYTYVKSGNLVQGSGAQTQTLDKIGSEHYRGGSAGTVNTQNALSNNIHWSIQTKNSWGKPNNQSGSPHPNTWGDFPNDIAWKMSPPHDKTIRLNAGTSNVYRRQPTNSLGWVGGVLRCGGLQGDMLGCYLYNKSWLSDKGFKNRVNLGYALQYGLGRRQDGGNINVTFTVGIGDFAQGFGGDPRALVTGNANRTWGKGQGENFSLAAAQANAFVDPAQGEGTIVVFSGNSAAQYAEFGNVGEIMGGWVNGQLTITSNFG